MRKVSPSWSRKHTVPRSDETEFLHVDGRSVEDIPRENVYGDESDPFFFSFWQVGLSLETNVFLFSFNGRIGKFKINESFRSRMRPGSH